MRSNSDAAGATLLVDSAGAVEVFGNAGSNRLSLNGITFRVP
jgi:hypothetical protein